MKVINTIRNTFKNYPKGVRILFFLFLLGVLSYGRPFSILHIDTPLVPLYITEIFLFISLPLVVMNFKQILKLPKKFLVSLSVYFLFGCFYLASGLLNNNLFALRDIVLCGYILFLPITFIILSKKENLLSFLRILILTNVIGVIFGMVWIFNYGSFRTPIHFIQTLRTFNLGLYYWIAMSFLIAFFDLIEKKTHRFLVLILSAFNIYATIFFKTRTIWAAGIALSVFFLLVYRKKFLKFILYLIPILAIVLTALSYYDFKDSEFSAKSRVKHVLTKSSVKTLIKKEPERKEPCVATPERKEPYVATPEWKEPCVATPEGLPVHKLPSRRLSRKGNIVWRLDIWYQAVYFNWKSGWRARFFGKGFGVYPRYLVWYKAKLPPETIGADSRVIPTHNHLVSLFYKLGFFGLGLFLFMNGYVFIYGLRYIKKCKTDFSRCFLIGSLGAFVFWHTAALFFDVINSPPTSIFLWIMIGLIFSIVKVDKKSGWPQPGIKDVSIKNPKSVNICGMKVNVVQMPEVITTMEEWIKNRDFGNYIAVSNAFDVILSQKDGKLRDAVNNSSLSVPDGISLVLAVKAYGYNLRNRVYGPDLLLNFLKATKDKGYSHFFYGTTNETLEKLVVSLKKQFPRLKVSGTYPSFFRELTVEDKERIAKIINDSTIDVLWVGIGCPRQELWMHDFKDRLEVPVMVGVGAAFDFLSGIKPQAPRWIRDNGLEWLFRLIAEPRRLWRRYLVGNSIFVWIFLKEFVKVKILKKSIKKPNQDTKEAK